MNSAPFLGKLVAVYPVRSLGTAEKILYVVWGLVNLLLLLVSWIIYTYAYTHYGPSAADGWSYPWTVAAWLMGAGWVLGVSVRFFSRRWRVGLFMHGLEIHRPLQAVISLEWQRLSGISIQNTQTSFFRYSWAAQKAWLYTCTGERLTLGGKIDALPELITRIKANLYPRLMPDYRVAFRDGQWVTFGPVTIHRSQGMRVRKRLGDGLFPWDQVRQITICDGYLVIELFGHVQRFRAGQIPNVELLLQLIREELP